MDNILYAGFGRAMMSPYRVGADGKYVQDADGHKILMHLPMAGYGNNSRRLCKRGRAEGTQARVYDRELAFELFNSCIAYKDAAGSVLLHFSLDSIRIIGDAVKEVRSILKTKYDIDPERVFFTETHTHSSIDFFEYSEEKFIDYDGRESSCAANNALMMRRFVNSMVEAADAALKDLAPVKVLKSGSIRVERPDGIYYNYVRHYPRAAKENPEFCLGVLGDNFNGILPQERYLVNGQICSADYYHGKAGTLPEESKAHMSVANHDMLLLWIEREGRKPLAICNFRAHASMQSGSVSRINTFGVRERQYYSPDFIGPFRDKIEHELGCLCVYYQGECGNINPKSNLKEEQPAEFVRHDVPIYDAQDKYMGTADIPNDFGVYGQGLADFAIKALQQQTGFTDCLGDSRIKAEYRYCPVPFRSGEYYTEIDDRALTICRDMVDYFRKYFGTADYDAKNISAMARASGGAVHSFYHANNVINRKAMEPVLQQVELAAYRIGGAVIAMSPSEMFDSDGDLVKKAGKESGYVNPIVCGYSNQDNAYIPSELGFTQGKTVTLAGDTHGRYVKADGSIVEYDAPAVGMFGCFEADQCMLAPVFGAGKRPLYGVYDGSDGIHEAGDPVYVGEYLAFVMGDMLKNIR